MTENSETNYTVGYKKPSTHTRFKKGKSGNLRGRSRELVTVATMMAEELQSTVPITEDGKRIKFNKLRLILKQAINKAIAGNFRPLVSVIQLLSTLERLNQTPTKKRRKVSVLDGIDLQKLSVTELSDLYRKLLAESH